MLHRLRMTENRPVFWYWTLFRHCRFNNKTRPGIFPDMIHCVVSFILQTRWGNRSASVGRLGLSGAQKVEWACKWGSWSYDWANPAVASPPVLVSPTHSWVQPCLTAEDSVVQLHKHKNTHTNTENFTSFYIVILIF